MYPSSIVRYPGRLNTKLEIKDLYLPVGPVVNGGYLVGSLPGVKYPWPSASRNAIIKIDSVGYGQIVLYRTNGNSSLGWPNYGYVTTDPHTDIINQPTTMDNQVTFDIRMGRIYGIQREPPGNTMYAVSHGVMIESLNISSQLAVATYADLDWPTIISRIPPLFTSKIKNKTIIKISAGTPIDLPDGTTYITVEEEVLPGQFQPYTYRPYGAVQDITEYAAKVQNSLWLVLDDLSTPASASLRLNNKWTKGNADEIESKFAEDLWPASQVDHTPFVKYYWRSAVDSVTGLNTGRCKTFTRPYTNYTNPQRVTSGPGHSLAAPYYIDWLYNGGGSTTFSGSSPLVWLVDNSAIDPDTGQTYSSASGLGTLLSPLGFAVVENASSNFEFEIGDSLTLGVWDYLGGTRLGTATGTVTERAWGYNYIEDESGRGGPHWYNNTNLAPYLRTTLYLNTYCEDFSFYVDWENGRLIGSGSIDNCISAFMINDTFADSPIADQYMGEHMPQGAMSMAVAKGRWDITYNTTTKTLEYRNITDVENGLVISVQTQWDDEAEEESLDVFYVPKLNNTDNPSPDIPDFCDTLDVKDIPIKINYDGYIRKPTLFADIEVDTGNVDEEGNPIMELETVEVDHIPATLKFSVIGPWQNARI